MAWDEWMDEWMDGMDLVKSTKNGWRIAVKTFKNVQVTLSNNNCD